MIVANSIHFQPNDKLDTQEQKMRIVIYRPVINEEIRELYYLIEWTLSILL